MRRPSPVRAAKAADRWLRRRVVYRLSSRRRLLFNLSQPSFYSLVEPVVAALDPDRRLEIFFTTSSADAGPTRTYLLDRGIAPERILPRSRVTWRRWDAVIEPEHWITPPLVRATELIQTFHGSSEKAYPGEREGHRPELEALRSYDHLFCTSRLKYERILRLGLEKRPGAALLVGVPRLDVLVAGSLSRDDILGEYGADPGKRSVLYAPSWNPELSLNRIGEALIEALSGGDWTLLVKPHPISFRLKPPAPGVPSWGQGKDWRSFIDRREREGRLIHVRDQMAARVLTAADVLVTDYGALLFEYLALARPVFLYGTEESAPLAGERSRSILSRLRKVSIPFQKAGELRAALESGGERDFIPDEAVRREILSDFFHDIGRATGRAVGHLYRILRLPPPNGGAVRGGPADRD